MKPFVLEISTPKGVYLHEEVKELYLKTSLGYMGILAGHDTLITGVDMAPCCIIDKDNHKNYYALFAGVLNVKKDVVELAVNNIEHTDAIDLERAKKAHERAEARINKKDKAIDIQRAELALKRALVRMNTMKKDIL
ncbi:MAG: ATP synthase F1 subunit epsilon [Bacilli bacterium]|nr:ATP synthase F1 subunit epsilon [Bacilli bacterium]